GICWRGHLVVPTSDRERNQGRNDSRHGRHPNAAPELPREKRSRAAGLTQRGTLGITKRVFEGEPMLKQYLMTAGPTPVPERVALAMAQPILYHRAPVF